MSAIRSIFKANCMVEPNDEIEVSTDLEGDFGIHLNISLPHDRDVVIRRADARALARAILSELGEGTVEASSG